MRWLGLLAIAIVGAAIYLLTSLSGAGEGIEPRRTAAAPEAPSERPEATNESPSTPSPGSSAPIREIRPIPLPERPRPTPTAPTDRVDTPPSIAPPADAGVPDEEREWTEQERWQKLWAANGRFEKGNYPGAVELATEIARRYPPWQEDAWKVAIKAHCAMEEPDKANALFQKMTDAPAIEEITTYCTTQNVKLAKSQK